MDMSKRFLRLTIVFPDYLITAAPLRNIFITRISASSSVCNFWKLPRAMQCSSSSAARDNDTESLPTDFFKTVDIVRTCGINKYGGRFWNFAVPFLTFFSRMNQRGRRSRSRARNFLCSKPKPYKCKENYCSCKLLDLFTQFQVFSLNFPERRRKLQTCSKLLWVQNRYSWCIYAFMGYVHQKKTPNFDKLTHAQQKFWREIF